MLKKIAHNSTIPSLAGHSDIRPLQDLIIAEKAVLGSLQKLSADFAKASENLRLWALGEGDDLADTLNVSTALLSYFSSALSQYASHEHDIREHLKAIRTREEALDDMKRRRKSLLSKADSADKKLNRMSPEHKNLTMQAEILSKLNDDIKAIDHEIMIEETKLQDFKRTALRTSMALKFGGMLECCEKGIVVGEIGKLVAAEIPDDVTQPGAPRSIYKGHARVESLGEEAHRRIESVTLSAMLSAPTVPRDQVPARPVDPRDGAYGQSPGLAEHSPNYLGNIQGLDRGLFIDSTDASGLGLTDMGSFTRQSGPTEDSPSLPTPPTQTLSRGVDDFGVTHPTTTSHGGGRFVTFPVKSNRSQPNLPRNERSPLTLGSRHFQSESLSSSIAAAMGSDELFTTERWAERSTRRRRSLDGETNPLAFVPPLGRLPGDPWKDNDPNEGSSQEEPQLAYMKSIPERQQPTIMPVGQGGDGDRHVRFGTVPNANQEDDGGDRQPIRYEDHRDNGGRLMASREVLPLRLDDKTPTSGQFQSTSSSQALNTKKEERELNAAAAREISRELDELRFDPPSPVTSTHLSDTARETSPYRGGVSPVRPALHSPLNISPRGPQSGESSPHPRSPVSPSQSYVSSSYPGLQGQSSPNGPRSPVTPPPYLLPALATVNEPILDALPSSFLPAPAINPSPYRAPPEQPLPTGKSLVLSVLNKSTSSLPSSPAPPGTRTITAAAFRRPQARAITGPGATVADTGSTLVRKRTLPSSPYPVRSQPNAAANTGPLHPRTDDMGTHRMRSESYSRYPQQQQQQQQQQQPYGNVGSTGGEASHYEYIPTYTDAPVEMGSDQNMGGNPWTGQRTGGYAEGKFATDLEGERLR